MSKQLDPLKTTTPELHSKGTVIIVGDSWACGEWKSHRVIHKGLEQYLIDDGYRVINKGVPGGNNTVSIDNLCEELAHADLDHENTQAFFFCTDWQRDIIHVNDNLQGIVSYEVESFKTYDENIAHKIWHRLLSRLEKLSQKSRVKIGLIGGCADTVTVGNDYQGIYVACQSMTNLCLGQDEWRPPVLSLFNQNISVEKKTNQLLDDMNLAIDRLKTWKENPNWFWPDGCHANRAAHKRLFDYLKEQQLI